MKSFRRSFGYREFKESLENNREKLRRLAYSWCHDPTLADDLTQETMAKALTNAGKLRDPGAMNTWLVKILLNCWRAQFRRKTEVLHIEDFHAVNEVTPEHELERDEVVSRVRKAVALLPESQRQVLTLVDLEGFSYIEVAETLEIPIGTVMSRLCRARGALKEKLLKSEQRARPVLRRLGGLDER